jgi:hypothetical protein
VLKAGNSIKKPNIISQLNIFNSWNKNFQLLIEEIKNFLDFVQILVKRPNVWILAEAKHRNFSRGQMFGFQPRPNLQILAEAKHRNFSRGQTSEF